jgi:hypothetical protein
MTDKQQEISSTTQKFLDIFDITNDVTVLRDGTVSMILMISAMNFGLLADQEQDSIIYSYASLLNSLNFPIQIVVNSKTKDATSYLRLLENQAEKASSEDKRGRIKRYQNFVGQLIRERNVLDKKFYVIIPASPIEVGMLTPQSVLPGSQIPQLTQEQKAAVIEKGIGVLEPRRDHLISQFNRIGLYARPLATQEIIEIFYNNYNPEASEGQQITESQDYTSAMVNAGVVKPTERVIPSMQPAPPEPVNEMPPIVQEPAQPVSQPLGQPTDQPIVATPRSPLKETTRSPVLIPKAPAMPPPAEL